MQVIISLVYPSVTKQQLAKNYNESKNVKGLNLTRPTFVDINQTNPNEIRWHWTNSSRVLEYEGKMIPKFFIKSFPSEPFLATSLYFDLQSDHIAPAVLLFEKRLTNRTIDFNFHFRFAHDPGVQMRLFQYESNGNQSRKELWQSNSRTMTRFEDQILLITVSKPSYWFEFVAECTFIYPFGPRTYLGQAFLHDIYIVQLTLI